MAARLLFIAGLSTLAAACTGLRALDTDALDDTGAPDDTDPDTNPNDSDDTPVDTSDSSVPDTGPAGPVAPNLQSFSVAAVSGRLELTFRVTDPDNDLSGGVVEITRDGQIETRAIPGSIDVWNPSGDSKIYLDMPGCGPQNAQLQLRVRDNGSRWSNARSATFSGAGAGTAVSETGNDDLSATDLGTVYPPMTICGDLYAATSDSTGYTGDLDWLVFDVGRSGSWTFTLTWANAAADYDLYLFDDWGLEIASSIQDGATQPERITTQMFSGDLHYIGVAGWSGGGGAWTLKIQ